MTSRAGHPVQVGTSRTETRPSATWTVLTNPRSVIAMGSSGSSTVSRMPQTSASRAAAAAPGQTGQPRLGEQGVVPFLAEQRPRQAREGVLRGRREEPEPLGIEPLVEDEAHDAPLPSPVLALDEDRVAVLSGEARERQ